MGEEIAIKLLLAVVLSGLIGFDREFKNRPAGIRTHSLVCIGAVVITMVQNEIVSGTIKVVIDNPSLKGVISSDSSRLTAQIVSGIGFLGAGTIIVNRQRIKGLTTAASLWVTAAIGIAVGMGYYLMAIFSTVTVILVLSFLSKLIQVNAIKKIEIQYLHRIETKEFLFSYFTSKKIVIRNVDFNVELHEDYSIYTNLYTIELPRNLTYSEIIEDISLNKNIMKIRMIDV